MSEELLDMKRDLYLSLKAESRLAEGTEIMLWLWDHAANTSFSGVRGTFLLDDLAEVAGRDAPFAAKLGQRRDAAESRVAVGMQTSAHFRDWMDLCRATGEQDRVVRWIREHPAASRSTAIRGLWMGLMDRRGEVFSELGVIVWLAQAQR